MRQAPSNQGQAWTPEDEVLLVSLAREGQSADMIAKRLDRSVTAVYMRLEYIIDTKLKWDSLLAKIKKLDDKENK